MKWYTVHNLQICVCVCASHFLMPGDTLTKKRSTWENKEAKNTTLGQKFKKRKKNPQKKPKTNLETTEVEGEHSLEWEGLL